MNDMTPEEASKYFSSNLNSIIDRTVPKSSNKVINMKILIKEAIRLRKRMNFRDITVTPLIL